jgi:hypothetical protein
LTAEAAEAAEEKPGETNWGQTPFLTGSHYTAADEIEKITKLFLGGLGGLGG